MCMGGTGGGHLQRGKRHPKHSPPPPALQSDQPIPSPEDVNSQPLGPPPRQGIPGRRTACCLLQSAPSACQDHLALGLPAFPSEQPLGLMSSAGKEAQLRE